MVERQGGGGALTSPHRLHTLAPHPCPPARPQVSDKERRVELDTLFRDVASVLSEKCINPQSSRPYTISVLERALRDAHISVDPKRPAKAQALEVRAGGLVGAGAGAD